MGAPIRTTTSDIPDFSTYPAAPSDHLLSAPPPPAYAGSLQDVATQVGSTLGAGMNVFYDARERAIDRIDSLRSSLDALYCSMRDRATEVTRAKLEQVKAGSRAQVVRAQHYAEERPLAVIAAAGVAGILLGIGARAWRERRG